MIPLIILISYFTMRGSRSDYIKSVTPQYYTDLEPDNFMRLANGWILRNIYDMHNAMAQMDETTYSMHVNKNTNQFSDWTANVFNDRRFAQVLARAKSRAQMAQMINDKIAYLHQIQKKTDLSNTLGLNKEAYLLLLDYIQHARLSGQTNEQIHRNLVNARWQEMIVKQLLYGSQQAPPIGPTPEITKEYGILKEYVQEAKALGHEEEEIHTNIMQARWKEDMIAQTIYGVMQSATVEKHKARISEEDRMALNRYILTAINTGISRDRIIQNLVKASWPVEIVEHELDSFMTRDSRVDDYLRMKR